MNNSYISNDAAYITLASASKKYDVSLHTLRSWCKKNLVSYIRVQGGTLAMLETSLLELLNKRNYFVEVQ